MVKGAKLDENSSNEEYHDHYRTVVEALKKYGRPYRHKMENDFWRIKGKMTQEEMKNHVLEFWSSGDLVRHNPFLNRNLWGRTENWNETGVKWERKRGGYDQEGWGHSHGSLRGGGVTTSYHSWYFNHSTRNWTCESR